MDYFSGISLICPVGPSSKVSQRAFPHSVGCRVWTRTCQSPYISKPTPVLAARQYGWQRSSIRLTRKGLARLANAAQQTTAHWLRSDSRLAVVTASHLLNYTNMRTIAGPPRPLRESTNIWQKIQPWGRSNDARPRRDMEFNDRRLSSRTFRFTKPAQVSGAPKYQGGADAPRSRTRHPFCYCCPAGGCGRSLPR